MPIFKIFNKSVNIRYSVLEYKFCQIKENTRSINKKIHVKKLYQTFWYNLKKQSFCTALKV